jgi:hypothetical protein
MDKVKEIIFGKEDNKKKMSKNKSIKKEKIIYNRRINVAGISNYYDVIKDIIKSGTERGIYTRFKGYTLKDFKNTTESIGEVAEVETNTINLEIYEYNNKPAIKVLLEGEHGKFYEIGSIPKKELKELLPYIGSKKLKVKGFFVGGLYRKYDQEQKGFIDTEYELGIELLITIKE